MAETLKLKLEDFKQALTTLDKAIKAGKNEIIRDSVIKRFEYCFELGWKTVKIFLFEKFGSDIFAPKDAFRELLSKQLISPEDTEELLSMVDDRNKVIHTYDESFADEIYKRIINQYFDLMKKISEIINL
jgi:nucleotidyltransferase substrate binding protein (TIGR01987 family)